jgi:7-cyano-7-deazaguanine reductase
MNELPLGKTVDYPDTYSPELLFPIARQTSRELLGISSASGTLPFSGVDIWNAYELSWLSVSGKPQLACAEFRFPCQSANIVESKSFKLYLNSFNQTRFNDPLKVQELLINDLSSCAGTKVEVKLHAVDNNPAYAVVDLSGICLDSLDVSMDSYSPDPTLLNTTDELADECLYSHLLRSLCPVTGQPDWGSVIIRYAGSSIDHSGLLKYLIGYRQHQEFHEQCVERIFVDIMAQCNPTKLSVYARYVRRGGLDINPFRSTGEEIPENHRLIRQ